MSNQDVVVGAADGYDFGQISVWANSLVACGFRGRKVLLCYNTAPEVIETLRDRGFLVIRHTNNVPAQSVHARRFFHISKFADEFFDVRFIIATDVRDVAFQFDPFDWLEANLNLEKKSLCVPSEGMIFCDQAWALDNILAGFGAEAYSLVQERQILNCGVVAGTRGSMVDFCMAIYMMAHKAPGRITDQPAMNLLLAREPWSSKVFIPQARAGFAATLGILAQPEYHPFVIDGLPVIRNGEVLTPDGRRPYNVVHQYDRIPELAQDINRKWWEE